MIITNSMVSGKLKRLLDLPNACRLVHADKFAITDCSQYRYHVNFTNSVLDLTFFMRTEIKLDLHYLVRRHHCTTFFKADTMHMN